VKPRSILLFEQTIKSEATLKNYSEHLRIFLEFAKIKDYDSLLQLPHEKLQEMVEDYIIHLKNKVNPNSVPVMIQGIKHFFIINRIPIHWEIIRRMIPAKVKSAGSIPWSTAQIKKMLDVSSSKRNSALIHFLSSSGARIGVLDHQLQIKHLVDMGEGCKGVLLYADSTEEYWSFLTPEASKSLKDYFVEREQDGEKFYPETLVFRQKYRLGIEKPRVLKSAGGRIILYRIIQKSRIKRNKVNRNYDIQMDHGFRKRFNTVLKINNEVNSNIAEKLMGHKNGLDGVYFKPTKEQCFKEFRKAIPELSIDESIRLEEKIKHRDEQIEKLESDKDKRIAELELKMENINELLKRTTQA